MLKTMLELRAKESLMVDLSEPAKPCLIPPAGTLGLSGPNFRVGFVTKYAAATPPTGIAASSATAPRRQQTPAVDGPQISRSLPTPSSLSLFFPSASRGSPTAPSLNQIPSHQVPSSEPHSNTSTSASDSSSDDDKEFRYTGFGTSPTSPMSEAYGDSPLGGYSRNVPFGGFLSEHARRKKPSADAHSSSTTSFAPTTK